MFSYRCELAGYLEIVLQPGDEPSAQCSVYIHKLTHKADVIVCLFFLVNNSHDKKQQQCIKQGQRSHYNFVGGGAGRHGIFSKSVFLEGTSIISPMYIKLSAVTDTAINGSLKYIIINPFQAIVPQNNTQISFILT